MIWICSCGFVSDNLSQCGRCNVDRWTGVSKPGGPITFSLPELPEDSHPRAPDPTIIQPPDMLWVDNVPIKPPTLI